MATELLSTVHGIYMSDIHITFTHLITLLYRFWYPQFHITSFSMLTCSQVTLLGDLISHIVKVGWSQSFISGPIMTITVQWFLFWCTTRSVPFEESTLQKQKQISMHVSRFYNIYFAKIKRDSKFLLSFQHLSCWLWDHTTCQHQTAHSISSVTDKLCSFFSTCHSVDKNLHRSLNENTYQQSTYITE
jgi:hypothetical protein